MIREANISLVIQEHQMKANKYTNKDVGAFANYRLYDAQGQCVEVCMIKSHMNEGHYGVDMHKT